jgi:hypothetical protein
MHRSGACSVIRSVTARPQPEPIAAKIDNGTAYAKTVSRREPFIPPTASPLRMGRRRPPSTSTPPPDRDLDCHWQSIWPEIANSDAYLPPIQTAPASPKLISIHPRKRSHLLRFRHELEGEALAGAGEAAGSGRRPARRSGPGSADRRPMLSRRSGGQSSRGSTWVPGWADSAACSPSKGRG